MSTLNLTNTFIAGTLAKASEVNANFTDLVNWSTTIANDNFGTMTGAITWAITTGVKAISINNSGNEGSLSITQSSGLNPNKSSIRVIDNAAQTSGDAEVYISMTSLSSTIPVLRLDYAGAQVFAVKKDRLEMPVRTLDQRDALSSAATGSILYVEDSPATKSRGMHVKDSEGWGFMSVPAGVILPFGGSVAPDGYLPCIGGVVSKATYATLFAAIGHTWAADPGGGNFTLPDLRGRAPIGAGTGAGLTPRTLGDTSVGSETAVADLASHTHTTPNHAHTLSNHVHGGPSHDHTIPAVDYPNGGGASGFLYASGVFQASAGANTGAGGTGNTGVPGPDATDTSGAGTTGATGAAGGHANVQPSAVVTFIIKY